MGPRYELSDEAEAIVQDIARRCGVSECDVLAEAISLLEIVVEAKLAGKKLMVFEGGHVIRLAGSDAESPYRTTEMRALYEIDLHCLESGS